MTMGYSNKYSRWSKGNYTNGQKDSDLSVFGDWHKYKRGMMYFFGGTLLLFVLLYLVKQIFREHMNQPAILDQFFKKPASPEKVKGESKGETLCREAARKVFGKDFVKIRPDFLKNQVTGHNLELDIYNEELRVAIEFNGQQHYKYVPFFHKNYEHFLNQKYRDEIKKMLCKQHNIHLIEIPYDMQPTEIESLIRLEAIKLGLLVAKK